MTAAEIMKQLEQLGTDRYQRILLNHGAAEPVLGVKIEELKKIQKRIRKDYRLSLELYESGVYDAQYLAGLIADETQMTRKDLRHWLAKSNSAPIAGTVVAWVAAESSHGLALALDWIDSKQENTAQTGWATLSGIVALQDDSELDLALLKQLLQRVERTIHRQPNLVRYVMNGFVISVGSYVRELTAAALKTGEAMGEVSVDMGATACQVPYAPEYIQKVQKRGTIGKKRKTVRC